MEKLNRTSYPKLKQASYASSPKGRKSPMELGDELIEESMSQMKEALKQ